MSMPADLDFHRFGRDLSPGTGVRLPHELANCRANPSDYVLLQAGLPILQCS